jgi:hypothetical protein
VETNYRGEKVVPMDRAIFNLEASVEATSLYILLCALEDQEEPLTLDRASVLWNGTREDLVRAAEELILRGVLDGNRPLNRDQPIQINPRETWRQA